MKRYFIIILLSFFTIALGYLFLGIAKKINHQQIVSEQIQRLPVFSFPTLDGQLFNSSGIHSGPVLIIRFHPECEHCRYEISEIFKSVIPKNHTNIILISSAVPDSIRTFLNEFNYSEVPSVIPLIDSMAVFGDIFGSDYVPSNFIYDKDLKLITVLKGETKVETIFKYLSEDE